MSRIAVTGSLAYDYISTYDRPFSEVILPDQIDSLSVCFLIENRERHFGGTGGNVAYDLAMIDEPCDLVAAVGYDFGAYRDLLDGLGVNTEYVKELSEVPTASANIITDPKGNQIATFHPGAMMADGQIDAREAFENAEVIIIAPDHTVRMMHYIELAHKVKTDYFFDPGQNLPLFSKEDLLEAIDGATGVFLNDYELELLKKKTDMTEDELLEKAKLLIVTLGKNGSLIMRKEEGVVTRLEIPIAPPIKVKDPTGCGDAYRAGFLKGYVSGRDLDVCGRMGALLATYVVEQTGTQNHSLGLASFEERYQEAFS